MKKPCIQCGKDFDDGGVVQKKMCSPKCAKLNKSNLDRNRLAENKKAGMFGPRRSGLALYQMRDKLAAWAERNGA